jgi:hypothetical protein
VVSQFAFVEMNGGPPVRLEGDASIPSDPKRESGLQVLGAMYGNGNDLTFARFGVDMVAPTDALEGPSVRLNPPAHLRTGDRFQTATSRT